MSIYDKTLKNVAEVAAKIMAEKLHPNQQKLDVHEPEKDKLTAKDFEMLRAGKKAKMKEETGLEESGEMGPVTRPKEKPVTMRHKTSGKEIVVVKAGVKDKQKLGYTVVKEEIEELDELDKSTLGSYVKKAARDVQQNTYRSGLSAARGVTNEPSISKTQKRQTGIAKAVNKLTSEDIEMQEMKDMIDALILEYEAKGGVYRHQGSYGYGGKGAEHGQTDYKKENDLAKAADKPARKKYGSRQNYVRSTRVNESFTELLEKYTEGGMKGLNETLYVIQEEADNEQFTKELEKAKRKAAGQDRNDENIAKGSVQAVKNEEVEEFDEAMSHQAKTTMKYVKNPTPGEKKAAKDIKPGVGGYSDRYAMLQSAKARGALKEEDALDEEGPQGKVPMTSLMPGHSDKAARFAAVQAKGKLVKGKAQSAPQKEPGMKKEEIEQVDERKMTEPEMKERERIVKGMKKGLSGFKQRYGERAKSVMYATSAKIAKERA